MKKIFLVFCLPLFLIITACNDIDKKQEKITATPKELADSLEKEVEEGHNIAMPKSMRIPDLQKEVKRLIDSIAKLPAKAQEAAASYKSKLMNLDKELGDAYSSMENWMEAFGQRLEALDKESMKDSLTQRIKFFTEEKPKIDNIKEAVLKSVKNADSLLKAKR